MRTACRKIVRGCVEINRASGAPDNASLSHFSATTRPCWLNRVVRDPHRHAIDQALRRWRGGRRDDSGHARAILISTQVRGDPEKLLEQVGPGLVFSVEGVVFAQGLTLKDYQCDKAVGAISRDEYKRGVARVGPRRVPDVPALFGACDALQDAVHVRRGSSVRRALSKYDLTWPMKRDREINATCMYLGSFCLAYMALALLRLVANYAFTTKNNVEGWSDMRHWSRCGSLGSPRP